MEPDQNKSTDKNSSRESELKRRRPSLFPIRNSARRKSSMCQSYNVFDPHSGEHNSNRQAHKNNEADQEHYRECKSETQFEYKTPSVVSGYSSPRTTRSSPKQFIADTPFVPFVHQSLSKTVWQSDEIIPEEKQDIDRKQSQTQMPRKPDEYEQINQQKLAEQTPPHSQNDQSVNIYPDLPQVTTSHPYEQQKPEIAFRNLQICGAISVSVANEGNLSEIAQVNQNENQNLANQITLQEENYDGSTAAPPQYEVVNQIQHNEYVSKAPIYFEEAKKSKSYVDASTCVQDQVENKPNLSYSYLDCISVRPVVKNISEYQQQTLNKKLTNSHQTSLHIPQMQKVCQQTQIEKIKLQICNHSSEHIKSTKKLNSHTQTSIAEKLKHISQTFEQKIGIPRQYVNSSQQASVKISNYAQQTFVENKRFGITEQVNISMMHNYGQRVDEKIVHLQNYIKNIYESKEAQIKELRNRKSVDKQINTENASSSNQKKHISKISIRNFSTQYDPKDFGQNRSSLKRVSIADTKIIYEIDDSLNSTETFEQKKHSRRKGKEKEKEKEKDKEREKSKVKVELRVEDQEPESEVEQTRKSKRKASKTPKKKKTKQ